MNKKIIAIFILFVLLILVPIFFPLPQPTPIGTDLSCKTFSIDVKQNLENLDKQIELCEEKCNEIGLDLYSSTCRNDKILCLCLE